MTKSQLTAPTRLFREGDKVRVVEWNGRHFHDRDHGTELTTGCICEVDDDEEATSEHGVLVVYEEQVRYIAPCFLELVTPVEELEPYKLIDSPNTYNIVRDSAMVMTIHKKSHPNAKAAAEAECARLNEEWRKEHTND